MPKTWQSYSSEIGRVTLHTLPMVVRKVGDGYLRVVHSWQGLGQIPHRRDWLLHKIDRSQTTRYHHSTTGPTVCLEKHNMSI